MTQLEVILKFMESLNNTSKINSTEMLNEAIRACSDYDGIDDAIEQFLAAVKAAPDSATFLTECGIDVTNTDTGGITGSDAGGSVTKTADTTVWEIANTYTANSGATAAQNIFTGTNGWHVQATDFNDTIYSGGEDSISAGGGNDFIYLDGRSEVVITGGDNDTISVGSGVKDFTVKDFTAGKTTILGANNFSSVVTANSDGTSTVKFTRSGSVTSSSLAASNANVDLSKVTTIKGYFNASGNFVANSTLSSGNFLGNVTSEFDPSFLDVDADGNLSFTCRGLKLNIIGERNPTTKSIITAINSSNISSLSKKYQYVIIAGLYKWWLKEALELNEEATGLNFTDGSATVTEINLYFENYTSQSWLAYVSHSYDTDNGNAVSLSLVINERYFSSVTDENDTNGVVSGGTLDRTIAHEMNHGLFAANVNFFAKLPMFLKEGMAELIHGIDDKRLSSIRTLLTNSVNNNSSAWLDSYLRTDIISSSNAATLPGGGGAYPYAAGYIFLRWLARTASDDGILSDDKLSARVELRTDGIYYISGKSIDVTTAKLVDFNESYSGVSVGSASGNTYTLNSAIKQIVTYFNEKASWNISGVGSNVTIVADDSATGGDSISGSGSYALVLSGAGNDTISLSGARNSITGGAGNDVIYSGGGANTFFYTEGDGNDVIYNFSANDTLEVSANTCATIVSGVDVIVQAGAGSVTLKNAAGKTLNIKAVEVAAPFCKIGSVYYTSLDLAIAAANSGETISLIENLELSNTVSIPAGKNVKLDLNGKTITSTASAALSVSGNLTISDSSYYHSGSITGATYAIQRSGGSFTISDGALDVAAAWSISGTTATYKAAGKTAGYAISSDGKTFSYNSASGCETLATITGLNSGADASDISVSGKVITLSAEVLGTGTVSVSGDYTLKLASNVATPKDTAAYWNISGTTATYIAAGKTAGYVLSDDAKSVTYQNPTGDTLITITNLKEGATLSGIELSGTEVTLSNSVLGEATVYISSGYALKLGTDVVTPVTTPAYWSISGTMAIYTAASSTAGHYLMGDLRSIRYSAASGGNTLATVSGIKSGASLDGLSRKGKVVTLSASILDENTVTISEGYTLALARDVAISSTTAAHWKLASGVANYFAEAISAGYVLSDDARTANYFEASGGEILVAVTGVKSLSGISMSGEEITIAQKSLNQQTVTVTDGYTLKLADDVTTPESTAAHWEYSNGKANYLGEIFSAGYVLKNNQIVYELETGGETLITVTGVKSLNDISLSGTEITVAAAALNYETVTVSDGYTLKLASDVTTPESTAAHWEYSNGTANYLGEKFSAGYVLKDNQIVYEMETGGETLITVTGVKSLDGISMSGNEITVAQTALNYETVTVTDGYTLKLADDVTTPKSTAAHWEISNGTANYIGEIFSAGYVLKNNQIVYEMETGGETLITVTGVKSLDGISLAGSEITVAQTALNQQTVTVTDGYTLKLADDVTTPKSTAPHWEYSNGTANYLGEKFSAGYVLKNNQIVYEMETDGETLITVTGVKSLDGISMSGNEITIAQAALNQQTVTVTDGYTLKLADDVTTPKATAPHWEYSNGTANYLGEKFSAGYVLKNNQIVYETETGGETLITVTGVKSLDGISMSGNEITVAQTTLNYETVTVTDGYTLKLADDVTTPKSTAAHWEISNGTANYIGEIFSAGYVLKNNQIVYETETGGETLITVTGVKSLDGISLAGSEITVAQASLNQQTVTVTDGYTLKLGDDVTTPESTAAHWEIASGTANYIGEIFSAGYVLKNNQISYETETGGETLITVTGVKSLDGISMSGTEITIAQTTLNYETVTVTDGYTLKLADDVTTPKSTAPHWEYSNGTANYIGEIFSAGYVLKNNQIVYENETGGETLITVTGVKSLDGISMSGTEITIAQSSLNQQTVTVTDGYTLKLGDDVTTPESTAAHWEIASGTANYIGEIFSAGYVLKNNQISYETETGGENLITIRGLKNDASKEGINLNGKEITLNSSVLGADTVTVSAGYTLKLADDVATPETTAAHLEISGNTVIFADEETTSGYILVSDGTSIRYVPESGGDALFTITGVKEGASTDGISIDGTEVTLAASVLDTDTVSITSGYTLKLASNVPAPETTAAHWEISGTTATYLTDSTSAGYVLENNQIVYQAASGETLVTVTGVSSTEGLSLSGSEVVISAASLNQQTVTVDNGYTIRLSWDVIRPETTEAHWEISGNAATYISEHATAGYSFESASVLVYTTETGGESLVTVTGVGSTNGLLLVESEVVVSAAALNQQNVTVDNGYTLTLSSSVDSPASVAEHWEISGTTATYLAEGTSAGYTLEDNQIVYHEETSGDILATVTGVTSLDGISLSGTEITISAAALNEENVTVTEGYTLKMADDVPAPTTSDNRWEISGTTATYLTGTTSAGYTLEDNQIVYHEETSGDILATLTGVTSLNGISLSGTEITISAAALNEENVTVTEGYTLKMADDVPAPTTSDNRWEISGTTATYLAGTTSAGYILEDNQIVYHEETSGDVLATVTGVTSLNGISISGTEITISAAALNEENVTVTAGYTLALADDVTTSNTTAAHWEVDSGTANYISEYKTTGYVLADNQILYQTETGGEISITVSGLSANATAENISLNGTEITISAAALNQTDVTVSRGYTLKLASDVTTPETTDAHWEVASGTANYLAEYTSAGYVENSDGSISYNTATGGAALITITGLSDSATVDDISLRNKVITISAAALNQENVTVTAGYTLKLASDVTTPQTTAAHWEIANGTANYIASYTSAGYVLDSDGTISYELETGGETLITISGLSSSATASDISLSGTTVTLRAAALNQTDVAVNDGYTLKMASDVTTPETTAAHWEVASGTANYISTHTSAGYVENSNGSISYNTETGGTTQITVTGLRSNAPTSGLSLSGMEVTVMASVLGQNAVAISSGYTLKLGSDVTVPVDIAPYWYISGTNASYRAASKSPGYVVASDGRSITYAATTGGNTLTVVSGLKRGVTADELSVDGSEVTVAASALNERTVSISGNYTLNFASDTVTPYIIAAHWEVDGTTAHYLDDITTAGYVLASDAKSIVYNTQTGGDSLITVSGLKNNAPVSGISLKGNEVTLKSTVVGDGAVSISSGYSLVLGSGSYNALVTLRGGNSDDTLTNQGSGVMVYSGSGADLLTNKGMNSTVDAGAGNDTINSSAYNAIINAETGNDVISLSGNLSNVTVEGGAGNDTIYGDGGRHLFTYAKGDGYDEIYAFNERDTLQITSGAITKTTVSGDDVVFTVSTGTVTLKEAKGKRITTAAAKGNASTFIYDENLTYDDSKTSATLAASFNGTLNAADYYSSVLEIDGSEVTSAVQINGNAKANTIYGGSKADYLTGGANADILIGGAGADTLSGDAGDDTLTSGDGADTFVYSNGGGNDVITDFAGGTDKLKLASGSIDSVGFNKSDIIFKIGKGSVTIADGKDKKITLIDSAGETTTYIYGDKMTYNGDKTSVTLASNFRGTLNATDYSTSVTEIDASGVKNITRIVGNTLANKISGGTKADTILGGGGNDSLSGNAGKDILYGGTGNDVLSGGAGNDTLYSEAGNDTLTGGAGSDTFVYSSGDGNDIISDYTAGQDKIKIASGSIASGSVSGSDVILKVGTGSLTLTNAKDKKVSIINSSGKTSTQIYGDSGIYNESKSAITLASNLSGTLNSTDYDSAVSYIDGTKVTSAIRINGNAKSNTIYGGAKADYISGGGGKDKIFGGDGNDTLAGGAGNDTLTGGDGSNVFVYGSGEGHDVITDYVSGADKINLTSGTISSASVKGSDIILKVGNGSVTVLDGKDKKISVIDASGTTATRIYTTGMTYDENQLGVTLTSNYRGTLSADNYANSVSTIDASKVANALKIFGNDKANTITGTGKADSISGGAGNDFLIGGAGNDTLSGDKGNDTLTGGKGNDFFAYSDGDGNDVVTDYTAGQDRIKIVSGSIDSASISGSDVVLKVGSGSVKIEDAKDKKVTIVDADKKTATYIYSDGLAYDENKTSATLYSAFKGALGTADYASTVKVLDASVVTNAVQITGTSKANTITGGAKADSLSGGAGNDLLIGGAGNDTLNGDAGNDTLTGGAGSDIFVYAEGEGNDVVTDYTSGQDRIKLASGSISSAALSGNNVVFKIGSNTLTLRDAANTSISVIDANNKYATYNLSAARSGSNAYWFTENNFDTSAQLDSIMDVSADYSATNVETTHSENLAQISLPAYASEK